MASKYHPHALTIPADWETVLNQYTRIQRGTGKYSDTTIKADWDNLAHMARRIGKGPWDVTYLDLLEYFADQTWTPNTKKSRRRSMVTFWDWAIDLELTEKANPARRMAVPTVPKGVSKPTPDEVYELALSLERRRDVRLMIRIAGETGLRRGEYASCRREDLSRTPEGWNLTVLGKGNKTRIVQVPPYLGQMIREFCDEGFLFPGSQGGHMSTSYAGTLVARALRRAGATTTGHGLRHKAANDMMRDTDNDILAVQYQLGHENISTTEGYIVRDMGKLRRVMNARTAAA